MLDDGGKGQSPAWPLDLLVEEHRFTPEPAQPRKTAAATFVAFCTAGLLPLLPFVTEIAGARPLGSPFLVSALATAIAFALIGAARGRITGSSSWKAALQTVALGGTAASLAFGVGLALRGVV